LKYKNRNSTIKINLDIPNNKYDRFFIVAV
jgi:hypothetical protein